MARALTLYVAGVLALAVLTACSSRDHDRAKGLDPSLDSALLTMARPVAIAKCKAELSKHVRNVEARNHLARLTNWTVTWKSAPIGPVADVVGNGAGARSLNCVVPVINGEAMVTSYSPF